MTHCDFQKEEFYSLPNESLSPSEFLKLFQMKHGRAPRVLHLGNIANNAYGNAKLLNEIGFDCDVLCYDYYHIMGCPEWDDAEFEGEISDHFFPDWWSVNLRGYRRPKWFAQGPFKFGIKYLKAKRKNKFFASRYYWLVLEYQRFMLCSSLIKSIQSTLSASQQWLRLKRIFHFFIKALHSAWILISSIIMLIVSIAIFCITLPNFKFKFTFLNRLTKPKFTHINNFSTKKSEIKRKRNTEKKYHDNQWLRKHFSELEEEFKALFPQQKYVVSIDDIILYKSKLNEFNKLFQFYDIIHAYALDPIYPMLTNARPFVAYEHGTIREIPFENTSTGKLAIMAYAKADAIIVTNADNLNKARYMQPDETRVIHGYHRFDERKILSQVSKIKDVPRLKGRFGIDESVKVFFAPARQHHDVKGNHKIIEAVALLTQEHSGPFKMVFTEWGSEIDKSKKMISELGLDAYFKWIEPLGSRELMLAYHSVDCVMDQFMLPCIGGLPIDVMVVGECPVMSYLDDDLMAEFYGETIPLFNCQTPQEIANKMSVIITDPTAVKRTINECNAWVQKHHTHVNVVQKLVEAYQMTNVLS